MQGEIQRERWQTYLDEFSQRNAGRVAGIQLISEELGTQQ